jgi:hypothetical protein
MAAHNDAAVAAVLLSQLGQPLPASALPPDGSQFHSAGDFVVAWHSSWSPGIDKAGLSIQALQRYMPEPSCAPGLAAPVAMLIGLARRYRR